MVNIDVTLRDGGYRNRFEFDLDYARTHARLSVAAGFDWVEIAYRKGSFKPVADLGLTGRGDDSYIAAIAEEIGPEHVGLILHPRNIDAGDLPAMHRAGARLVRVCVPAGDPGPALDTVRQAKEVGFTVCVNLTRVSQLPARKVVEVAAAAADAGTDVVYLADSNGSLLPAHTARLATLVKSVVPGEVGLHAHNNLGLAMSNAMAAVDAGATWMDSSVLGMGKGPGNLVAEQWIAYLDRIGGDRYDLGTMLHLADLLGRSVPESAPSLPLPDLVLGHFDLSVEERGSIAHSDHRQSVHAARALAGAAAG
ncbi:4-hydroxy 2-oxovalerate aldolase [Kutzneria viridogrisea]|uniref:4-hydroxy 2-oxovalerate aldolase n=1 Tax=Kutzneria viridogrisea TaxID=47990 RepID=A0ABR6BQK3_9PSEU|nr:3-hydroxy-3-methylglutaryl-CoA lyase [Kutzneria albida]MBA8928926.1 4-hydroxy 2-oxovalerate aldolase [Kutzneria viridogrisea]